MRTCKGPKKKRLVLLCRKRRGSVPEQLSKLSVGICPIPKKYLLLIAGFVWIVAGINILNIGLTAAENDWKLVHILVTAVVLMFFLAMFVRIVRKNTVRIMNYEEEKIGVFRFLSARGYITMVLMMCMGVGLRYAGIVSLSWIQTFYTGLGTALALAGLLFVIEFLIKKTS